VGTVGGGDLDDVKNMQQMAGRMAQVRRAFEGSQETETPKEGAMLTGSSHS
jgi:hypothetical protein